MSRLIVKGLTKNIDEKNINFLFSKYGTITDIKTFRNKNNNIKNYFFIGFSDKESAKNAINNINGVFINTQRVSIEEARPNYNKDTISMYKRNSTMFKSTEYISETGILFVRNISTICSIDKLESLFSKFGYIEYIKMSKKKK